MKIIIKVLKICAVIFGTLCFAYGFIVGVLGAGSDGFHNSSGWRFLGIYILILGAGYIYSNKNKLKTRQRYYAFLFFEFVPLLLLVILAIYSIVDSGVSEFKSSGGMLTVICLVPVSLPSPLSLLFENKMTSNHFLHRTPNSGRL